MATPCKVNGYTYRQAVKAARQAVTRARTYTQKLLEDRPGPALSALYLAHIANAHTEILERLGELERIKED